MKKGFTLIELLVCVAIFVIITSVALWNNSQFNSSVLLTDLGYQIALSVRQAQVYGVTVRAPSSCTSGGCPTGFSSGYGIEFSSTTPTSYLLFEDKGPTPDHIYTSGAGELVSNYAIGKGYSLKRLCVVTAGVAHPVTTLDISFIRPEPQAWVRSNLDGAAVGEAHVYLQDPKDSAQREIIIEPTGQISIQNNATTC